MGCRALKLPFLGVAPCPFLRLWETLDENAFDQTFLFLLLSFLSISSFIFFHFYRSYHFPTFSFLKPQPIRAIIVKCDSSMYHIDVDFGAGGNTKQMLQNT